MSSVEDLGDFDEYGLIENVQAMLISSDMEEHLSLFVWCPMVFGMCGLLWLNVPKIPWLAYV